MYEKLKSVLDQAGTSASYDKLNFPAWRITPWKVIKLMFILSLKEAKLNIGNLKTAHNMRYVFTLRGWLVALHNTSFAVPEFNFKNIFSFLEIVLPTGLTYEGKQKGMLRQNSPS